VGKRATYDDVLAAPPHKVAEILSGDLVLSPATERIDRAHKLPIYARESVEHAWLVNPHQQTLGPIGTCQ
jgi:Uma2 family endonuclease